MADMDKIYEIKVPVYVSESVTTEPNGFVNVTYDDMINLIIKRIDEHNQAEKKDSCPTKKENKKERNSKIRLYTEVV